jgi:hypothetical protein
VKKSDYSVMEVVFDFVNIYGSGKKENRDD